jgi:hypothetical protein
MPFREVVLWLSPCATRAKSATGNQYDKVFNSGSGGKSDALKSASPARMDLAPYYDGSSRVRHDFADPLLLMPTDASVPFATVGPGQWQEVTEQGAIGRQWAESPDSIDTEGPELRYSAEYFLRASPMWTRLEVGAFDPAGVPWPGGGVGGADGDADS